LSDFFLSGKKMGICMGMFNNIIKDFGGFEILSVNVDPVKIDKYCDSMYLQYCKLFKPPTYLQNVEWKLRHYNAGKKIALSALFYTQTKYFINHNIKNICYYSMYYSLFNALSSNLLMLPQLKLGQVARVSHGEVFKHVDNYIVRLGMYQDNVIILLNQLRMMREIYSYHLPLGGSYVNDNKELDAAKLFLKLTNILPVVLQFSNMLSYLTYYAWNKKGASVTDEYNQYSDAVDYMFSYFISFKDHLGNYSLIDDADYERQGYFLRQVSAPSPINWFVDAKMCDDLEGGWEPFENHGYDICDVLTYLADVINA